MEKRDVANVETVGSNPTRRSMKDLYAKYKYDKGYGLPGHIVVRGVPDGAREGFNVGAELNTISRFVWGLGAAMNEVYNAHGALVKFQSYEKTNIRRAKLLTKIWRYCKENNIPINTNVFRYASGGRVRYHTQTEDFGEIIKLINANVMQRVQNVKN